jgi:hypothetical protein
MLVTTHLGVRLPVALGDRLKALARRENNRVSAVTRPAANRSLRPRRRTQSTAAETAKGSGMMPLADSPWLTAAEAAEYLKRGPRFIRREIVKRQEKLTPIRH